jgi:hydrogenase-4 component B
VDGPILTLLTAIIAALAGMGVLAGAWPRLERPSIGFAAAGLAGLAAVLALAALLLDDDAATLALPGGPPGMPFRLMLDPAAAFFAVLIFAAGGAVAAFTAAMPDAPDPAEDPRTPIAPLPVCIAGLGLAILATDAVTRGTGLALAGGAVWAMGPANRAAAAQLAVALLAAAAIVAGAGAVPPAALLAAVLGPGALAGLVPLHAWLTQAHRAHAPAAALLSGAVVPAALYAALRMLFDPAAAAPPTWYGLPLLVLGAASVLAGGLAGARRTELDTALAAGTVRQTGLTAIGLGLALTARAADLPGVTAMALGAVLLLAAVQAMCGTLLALAAGAIRHGAGTRRLDRLGGLVHRMPITTGCLLAGLFGVAALPPGAGFAAIWLLFQALLALPRAGGLPFQVGFCAVAAVLGLSAALASAGLLRLVGVVCLGRPRTPRGSAADEARRPVLRPLLALAATVTLLGVFVGPLLRVLADAPVRDLTGTGLGQHATLAGLTAAAEAPGYAALPVAGLLLLAAGLVLWLRRRAGMPSTIVSGPAWSDGFAAPPPGLPFGDASTQTTGAGFVPAMPCFASGASFGGAGSFVSTGSFLSTGPALAIQGAASRVPGAASVVPGAASVAPAPVAAGSVTAATAKTQAAWRPVFIGPMTDASGITSEPLGRARRAGAQLFALLTLPAPAVALILLAALLALCAWAGPT